MFGWKKKQKQQDCQEVYEVVYNKMAEHFDRELQRLEKRLVSYIDQEMLKFNGELEEFRTFINSEDSTGIIIAGSPPVVKSYVEQRGGLRGEE